jgi:hypothetical protein
MLCTLNLSDITLKICAVAMFVTVDVKTIFYTEYVSTFVVYVLTKFHLLSSSGSAVALLNFNLKQIFG